MGDFELKLKNIAEPSPKAKAMYQAVSELILENNSLDELTVSDITKKAGIGKGTAYEYFSSKEELIASTLIYEVGGRLSELNEAVEKTTDFRKKMYLVFDWIYDNKDYYQMIIRTLKINLGSIGDCHELEGKENCEVFGEIQNFLYKKIQSLMEVGCQQGFYKEQDLHKRFLAFVNAVIGYALSVSGVGTLPQLSMDLEETKAFLYDCIVKSLN